MKKVLIVDDIEINREILVEIMEDEYEILQAEDGIEAIDIIEKNRNDISVILLDLIMPKLDGYGVINKLKEMGVLGKIPVLVISGENDAASVANCFDLGASDFISKPFDKRIVQRRVRTATEIYSLKNSLEEQVENKTKELVEKNNKLYNMNEQIIDLLGNVVEARNMESGTHIIRVKTYTRILAEYLMGMYPEYGLTEEKINTIVSASAMHDVGKIMIPDNILLKPGRLTPEEFDIIKTHTVKGCEILKRAEKIWDNEYYTVSYEICRYHHEKFDGRGYPEGLKGDEIPISAQLVSVADCYDALVTERVYKKAFTPQKAYEMITGGQCGAFSEKIMRCFDECKEKMEAIALGKK